MKETLNNFQKVHVFSSCDCTAGEAGQCIPCSVGSTNSSQCFIDVSIIPMSSEIGAAHDLCFQATLKRFV